MSCLITIATYNEIDNLPDLVEEIHRTNPQLDILVIDDNSPDGTGKWAEQKSSEDARIRCLHRPGKLGLGTATLAGFEFALQHNYPLMVHMDADFSHHPRHLPEILARLEQDETDIVIGSRYVPGGGVEGWPWHRRLMSRGVNTYARWLLGLKVKDCSGAYRGFRTQIFTKLDFAAIRSRGYSFEEELLWHLKRAGARFAETPIVFRDRERGQSKINSREAIAALWIIFRLGIRNWLRF